MTMPEKVRTTHVGSLPRPPRLLSLLLAQEHGEPVDARQLETEAAAAVEASVRRQRQAGLDIVNDGEMGKLSYVTYLYHRLEGLVRWEQPFAIPDEGPMSDDFRNYPVWAAQELAKIRAEEMAAYACVAPLRIKDLEPLKADLRRLRAATDTTGADDVFMNAASPGVVPHFIENRHYATYADYIAALAEVLRPEYQAIVEAGFILQLDCPDLAGEPPPGLSEKERETHKAVSVEAINAATAGIDPTRMRMHLCWGNYQGPHDHDIPLAAVMPVVLQARPAAISFEAANPRHEHEWAYFDEAPFPDDKIAIPGVIDNTTMFVEHPELVAQRISRFVQNLGADRVIAGVDCGFGSHALGGHDPDLVFAKLKSLADGAEIASAS
jgi:5-methyltetrahydropteroyltriglutamate--homocysteine methyltransferase